MLETLGAPSIPLFQRNGWDTDKIPVDTISENARTGTNFDPPPPKVQMKILDALRSGFGFFLMSLGISRPKKKPKPTAPTSAGNR